MSVAAFLEKAWVGIEPTVKLLQSHALPLGYHAVNKVLLSGKNFPIASFFIPLSERAKTRFSPAEGRGERMRRPNRKHRAAETRNPPGQNGAAYLT